MRTTSKHIIISLYKINDKEKILKIVREKIYHMTESEGEGHSITSGNTLQSYLIKGMDNKGEKLKSYCYQSTITNIKPSKKE